MRNITSSSLFHYIRSINLLKTLLVDSHLTTQLKDIILGLSSSSSPIITFLDCRYVFSLRRMKLTISRADSIISSYQKYLAARCLQCIMQRKGRKFRKLGSFFISAINPAIFSSIECSQSVAILTCLFSGTSVFVKVLPSAF